tara:strand:+ start:66 stop:476 length:411 start_codon:yes stop_codon:yes gene_type:complete
VARGIIKIASKASGQKSRASVHPDENGVGITQLESKGVCLFAPLTQHLCEVTYVLNFVDKGKVPQSVLNTKMGNSLNIVAFLKAFYERSGLMVDAEVRLEARVHPLPKKQTKLLNSSLHFARRSYEPSSSRTFPER